MFGSSRPLPRLLPPRYPFYFHYTMPKRQSAEDASSSWVDAHFERWTRDRGSPKQGPRPSLPRGLSRRRAQRWQSVPSSKQSELPKGVASASGAGRPVFEQEVFTAEEAKMYWRELTNMAFTVTGHFEPQEYLSVVAGRPVVATRGNIASTPHLPTAFCGCDSPN